MIIKFAEFCCWKTYENNQDFVSDMSQIRIYTLTIKLHLRMKCWRFQGLGSLVFLLILNVPRRRFSSITIEINLVRLAYGFKNTMIFAPHIRERK